MKIEYVNSFNRNYIKMKLNRGKEERPRYQYKILEAEKIEGLLPISMHVSNDTGEIFYEISSMQNLSKWFIKGKIGKEWIETFIASLQTTLWSLEEYLLDDRNLLLSPDCIFQDMESEKILFLYYPYYVEKETNNIEKLLSFLVENVDEKETDTMEALYDIYGKWEGMRELFTLETFLLLWNKNMENKIKEPEHIIEENSITIEEVKEEEKKEDKKENSRITGMFFNRNKYMKMPEYKLKVAMEDWQYQSMEGEKENDQTTALVEEEKEERKLYGNGRQNRRVIVLDKLPLVLGKKGDMADYVLNDASISEIHARITENENQIYLEDLNATNGTYKNGVRLSPYEKVELLREDEVKLGKLEFTYR